MDLHLFSSLDQLAGTVVATVFLYVATLVVMRIAGRRTLTRISAFDVLVTILIGTVIGSSMLPEQPAILDGVGVLITLAVMQVSLAAVRQRSSRISRLVDYQPKIVVRDGCPDLPRAPSSAQLTGSDLMNLLRKEGVLSVHGVSVAILEPQGGISVVTREPAVDAVPI